MRATNPRRWTPRVARVVARVLALADTVARSLLLPLPVTLPQSLALVLTFSSLPLNTSCSVPLAVHARSSLPLLLPLPISALPLPIPRRAIARRIIQQGRRQGAGQDTRARSRQAGAISSTGAIRSGGVNRSRLPNGCAIALTRVNRHGVRATLLALATGPF